jgi:hypothetical protein
MLIPLPPNQQIAPNGSVSTGDPSANHTTQAAGRVVDVLSKPKLLALLNSYTEELQEVEALFWTILRARFPDYAEGVQLDVLGRVVGEERNGRSDLRYRARIKIRILINLSYGSAPEVIRILRTMGLAVFRLTEVGSGLRIEVLGPTDLAFEIPGVVREARAAGVYAYVVQATSVQPMRLTSSQVAVPTASGPLTSSQVAVPGSTPGTLSFGAHA